MPRLKCTFQQFLDALLAHGFVLHRQGKGSHARYRGLVGGEVRLVDVAAHRWSDEIRPKTLKSMIRQSGLPESLFRR
ncbi:type II toxin-antitoxin system HicA family toxin [Sphingopyxis sp.]|jgi:predicted RNA binding protein YcfA (HicA-like mRNA interferase family)|uniref:type II toxin-antitoxin system HicA family toxin n=1 Tax=Sphingopyxis sp. TaxID=1908224 RepID=UPI0039C9A0B0